MTDTQRDNPTQRLEQMLRLWGAQEAVDQTDAGTAPPLDGPLPAQTQPATPAEPARTGGSATGDEPIRQLQAASGAGAAAGKRPAGHAPGRSPARTDRPGKASPTAAERRVLLGEPQRPGRTRRVFGRLVRWTALAVAAVVLFGAGVHLSDEVLRRVPPEWSQQISMRRLDSREMMSDRLPARLAQDAEVGQPTVQTGEETPDPQGDLLAGMMTERDALQRQLEAARQREAASGSQGQELAAALQQVEQLSAQVQEIGALRTRLVELEAQGEALVAAHARIAALDERLRERDEQLRSQEQVIALEVQRELQRQRDERVEAQREQARQYRTQRDELRQEVERASRQSASAFADAQRAYLSAVGAFAPGLEGRQMALRSRRLAARLDVIRRDVQHSGQAQLLDRLEAVLLRLEMLDAGDAAESRAFVASLNDSALLDRIDAVLAEGTGPSLRMWLVEVKLILTGADRVG